MNTSNRLLMPLYILFAAVAIFLLVAGTWLKGLGVDVLVLHIANIFLLLLNIVTVFLQKRALANANPNVFVRSVIGGMMIKMFASVLAILLYVVITGSGYNKPAVFIAMTLYLFYLAAEVYSMLRFNRNTNG